MLKKKENYGVPSHRNLFCTRGDSVAKAKAGYFYKFKPDSPELIYKP